MSPSSPHYPSFDYPGSLWASICPKPATSASLTLFSILPSGCVPKSHAMWAKPALSWVELNWVSLWVGDSTEALSMCSLWAFETMHRFLDRIICARPLYQFMGLLRHRLNTFCGNIRHCDKTKDYFWQSDWKLYTKSFRCLSHTLYCLTLSLIPVDTLIQLGVRGKGRKLDMLSSLFKYEWVKVHERGIAVWELPWHFCWMVDLI